MTSAYDFHLKSAIRNPKSAIGLRGCWNHDRFCRGVLDVQEAVVRGRLYEMPSGIPVLQVPEEDILAHGTADPIADVVTQARFSEHLASYLEPMPESATVGGWGPVYGELLIFDDPSTRLPAIDRLEGFHPGSPSMYCRVLVPAITGETFVPVWLYVGEEITKRRLAPLGKSRWL